MKQVVAGEQMRKPSEYQTMELWQGCYAQVLTNEDARQIVQNVTSYFGILAEWEAAERRVGNSPIEVKRTSAPIPARGWGE